MCGVPTYQGKNTRSDSCPQPSYLLPHTRGRVVGSSSNFLRRNFPSRLLPLPLLAFPLPNTGVVCLLFLEQASILLLSFPLCLELTAEAPCSQVVHHDAPHHLSLSLSLPFSYTNFSPARSQACSSWTSSNRPARIYYYTLSVFRQIQK